MTTTSAPLKPPESGPTNTSRPRGRVLGGPSLRQLAQLGPVVALVLLAAVFAVSAPNFTSSANLTNVLQQVSITAIAAVGATVVILVAGIDLSVGSVVALTGSIAALYLQHAILSTGASAAVAVLLSLVVGTRAGSSTGC